MSGHVVCGGGFVFIVNVLPSKGKWTVPLPKVRSVGEDEVFKVMRTGKRKSEGGMAERHEQPLLLLQQFTSLQPPQRKRGREWLPR